MTFYVLLIVWSPSCVFLSIQNYKLAVDVTAQTGTESAKTAFALWYEMLVKQWTHH